MKVTCVAVMAGTLLLGRVAGSQSTSAPSMLTDAQIHRILVDRIDAQHQGVGIVVGVIDSRGRRIVAYGGTEIPGGSAPLGTRASQPVNGDSVFEIGSATKVFTSLLLADAVQRGEVALTDPASKYLPSDVRVPQRGGRQITLEDLATHTSGLPRLPANLAPKDPGNPYADYTVPQLYEFLSSYELTRDIGSRYEYSNLGVGLLGHLLARRAGMDYESLVRTRITGPLAMTSTTITLTDSQKQRLASGYNDQAKRVPNWDIPTLAGAGALRSTADDLLSMLAAELGYAASPLAPAMTSMLAVRRPTGTAGLTIGLGWHVLATGDGRELVAHDGGSGGYRSFIGFDPTERAGVVVLSNMSTTAGVDDIGRHLLNASLPLTAPAEARKEIALTPDQIERYVGKYELAPTFILTVTRDGTRLFLQATGQPKFELFAKAERDFFLRAVDAQVTFEVDAQGRATRLILHQNGGQRAARRIDQSGRLPGAGAPGPVPSSKTGPSAKDRT